MPLPPPLTSATVRGSWVNPVSGAPLPDDARATLQAVNDVSSPSGAVLLTTQIRRGVVAGGVVSWPDVVLSDSPGLAAAVAYRVQVSAPGFSFDHRFTFLAADVVGGVVDLALKAPSTSPPASADYVLAATRGAPGGVATLGSDGLLTEGQRPPGLGTSDHGLLFGLGDDDHPQYHNDARGDARYYLKAAVDAGLAARVPLSVVDAAGDLLVGTGVDALSRLPVGADWSALRVDPSASPPVRWVAPDAGAVYPLQEGYGFHSASIHPDHTKTTSVIQGWQARVWVPAGRPITKVGMLIGTAATGTSTNTGFAVYADDGSAQVASTAHDDALFKSTGLRSKAVQSVVAAQAAGRFVRVIASSNYSGSDPAAAATDLGQSNDVAMNGGTANRSAFCNRLSSFPASFDPATGSGVAGWVATSFMVVILVG